MTEFIFSSPVSTLEAMLTVLALTRTEISAAGKYTCVSCHLFLQLFLAGLADFILSVCVNSVYMVVNNKCEKQNLGKLCK